jgi:zinc/manganese transport system ATP-binding protein
MRNTYSVISAHDVTFGFDHRILVSQMTLAIQKGEFIGILGPNGSGKSTFLRAILGLVKPVAGELRVLGKVPKNGNSQIGYMPQMRKYAAMVQFTSRALLTATWNGLKPGLSRVRPSEPHEVDRILELVKATVYADRPFHQLSGGEKQRIYLAQALLGEPPLLLLDEPLSNLDPKFQDVFMQLLADIQRNLKVTILFTAHDPNPLLKVMNRVLFFANGKAVIGTPAEIITSETLTAMYGTPIEVTQFKNKLFVLSDTQQNILGEVRHHHD